MASRRLKTALLELRVCRVRWKDQNLLAHSIITKILQHKLKAEWILRYDRHQRPEMLRFDSTEEEDDVVAESYMSVLELVPNLTKCCDQLSTHLERMTLLTNELEQIPLTVQKDTLQYIVNVANKVLSMYRKELGWKLSQVNLVTACPQSVTTAAMKSYADLSEKQFIKNDPLFGLLHADIQQQYPDDLIETNDKEFQHLYKMMNDVVSTREQADYVLSTWQHQPHLDESTVHLLDEFILLCDQLE